ncbi:Uncharacterized protein FKW44_022660, partial [Caligus rogercresseyi]
HHSTTSPTLQLQVRGGRGPHVPDLPSALRDPLDTPCAHTFCKSCITSYLK